MSQDYFVGVGTISCHIGVCETIEGVTVACFNGVQPCLHYREAQTHMVEANKCANAGEVERLQIVGSAGCVSCHGHGLGCLLQEFDLDVLPSGASSPEALAGVQQACSHGC